MGRQTCFVLDLSLCSISHFWLVELVVPSLCILKRGLVKHRTCLGNVWSSSHCGGLLKKSISCADCVGMSSLALVSFIEFCLASGKDKVVNIPVISLASFSLSLSVCMCMRATISQCLGVSVFFSTFFYSTVCRFYVRLSCCSSTSDLCRAFWAAYVLKPLAALMHPVRS